MLTRGSSIALSIVDQASTTFTCAATKSREISTRHWSWRSAIRPTASASPLMPLTEYHGSTSPARMFARRCSMSRSLARSMPTSSASIGPTSIVGSGHSEFESKLSPGEARHGSQRIESMSEHLPTVYLARHGETAWSISGQHTGLTDLPLTERGERNARRLGERLSGLKFEKILTSPLQRAVRTCELAGFGK